MKGIVWVDLRVCQIEQIAVNNLRVGPLPLDEWRLRWLSEVRAIIRCHDCDERKAGWTRDNLNPSSLETVPVSLSQGRGNRLKPPSPSPGIEICPLGLFKKKIRALIGWLIPWLAVGLRASGNHVFGFVCMIRLILCPKVAICVCSDVPCLMQIAVGISLYLQYLLQLQSSESSKFKKCWENGRKIIRGIATRHGYWCWPSEDATWDAKRGITNPKSGRPSKSHLTTLLAWLLIDWC